MRIKKLYLLFIFIISLLLSNLYYSNLKPSLIFENDKSSNIVLLIDGQNYHGKEIISPVVSSNDNIIINAHFPYQGFSVFIFTLPVTIVLYILIKKYPFIDKYEFTSIVFRYRYRVILCWTISLFIIKMRNGGKEYV